LKYVDKTNTAVIDDDVCICCDIDISFSISAGDISARNISAENISAWDISAWGISAWNISYFAVCYAYKNILCKSIKGRRKNCKHFCLDGKITIKPQEDGE